jgi:hypothetical protein
MLRAFALALFATIAATSDAAASFNKTTAMTEIGKIKFRFPGYTYIERGNLHVCGFSPVTRGQFGEIKNIGQVIKNRAISTTSFSIVDQTITWPNEAVYVPEGNIPGYDNLIVIAGGFLAPLQQNGAITLLDRNTGKINKLSTTTDQWYHHVEWFDVDGDGLLDIVTAGANKRIPIIGKGTSGLYWLKQPKENPMDGPWEQYKVMDNGPDVYFAIDDFDGDGKPDLLAPEFFKERLALYTDLNFLNPSTGFKLRVIDDTIHEGFGLVYTDVNGDGKKEVVMSNHVKTKVGGGVYIYEIPSFKKHVATSGIANIAFGPNSAAPGSPTIVYPNTDDKLASILLAGDGSGKAYLLTPLDDKFNYKTEIFLDVDDQTVGTISAGDVDGDGKAEVFVPHYEGSNVRIFTFN